MVVGGRAGDAAEDLASADPPDQPSAPAPPRAPNQLARMPIRRAGWARIAVVHSTVWILAMQRGDDQPGHVEDLVVGPRRVRRVQHVADRVVLAHEQGVQQVEPDPPAVEAAGAPEQGRVHGDEAVRSDRDLARAQLGPAQRALELRVHAVDLRCVPPVGLVVDEVRGGSSGACGSRAVRGSRIGSVGQVSPGGRGTANVRCGSVPWLNQSRVWNCSHAPAITLSVVAGIIGPAGQQRRADQPRVRRHQPVAPLGLGVAPGTLRPNRVPAMPIAGHDRSL